MVKKKGTQILPKTRHLTPCTPKALASRIVAIATSQGTNISTILTELSDFVESKASRPAVVAGLHQGTSNAAIGKIWKLCFSVKPLHANLMTIQISC